MSYKLNAKILQDLAAEHEELVALLKTMCKITAPSNHEEKRAEFCKQWLEDMGAQGVYIDDALNVIYPINCEGNKPVNIFSAHTDTVFPDTEPMPMHEENGKLYCPGVGDDTASLATLMMAAKYITKHGYRPDQGLVLVCNSGEEGFGNLKGAKAFMEAYKGRVNTMVSFDGALDHFVNYAVGSTRYKIEIKTEGGHSFAKFGNKNAIAYMASLIDTLYRVQVPKGGKTTYNVGAIHGGTSVNTIAQQVEMLFEYRSDVREHLATMMDFFDSIITSYRKMGIEVNVEILGIRPCMGDMDKAAQAAFEKKLADIMQLYNAGKVPTFESGSTDANIPFSQGVTACTVGVYTGGGAHTREEWVELESLKVGYPFAMALILDGFRKNHSDLFE